MIDVFLSSHDVYHHITRRNSEFSIFFLTISDQMAAAASVAHPSPG